MSFVFGKVHQTERGTEGLAEASDSRDSRTRRDGRPEPIDERSAADVDDAHSDADERPINESDNRPDAVRNAGANPGRYARERAVELQKMLPEKARGRITMGTGVGMDDVGGTHVVVGTSEPRGYLRPGVTLRDGEELATGPRNAETSIST